ncbi:MAG: Gfo/Idh/MocA family protein [Halanaerobiaceae bacterium]
MSKKLKTGIIGVGGIANGKHMPALAQLDDEVEMAAFCDIIKKRAVKGAEEYGTSDAEVFTDYKELLKMDEIDIVHVLTPNDVHAPITIAALKAGKDVMCEKPMAVSSEEAWHMVETAEKTGQKLTIGYQSRHKKESRYLKNLIESNKFGEIYFAKTHALRRRGVPTWGVFMDKEKQGGGPLIDIATHSLDLTLWLLDNYEWEIVLGSTYNKLGKQKNTVNRWGTWDPDEFSVEDSGFALVKFKDGMTLILESSWAINSLRTDLKVLFSGTRGGAEITDSEVTLNGEEGGRLYTTQPNFEMGLKREENDSLREFKVWIGAVKEENKLVTLPEQAAVVSEILEAVYKSSETGKPVYND